MPTNSIIEFYTYNPNPFSQFTNRHELLDNLTISDWILPAVYQQHFTSIVWVKPPWASQIEVGKHELEIGKDENGYLKTSSSLPYYVSDLCYRKELSDARKFDLFVIELSHLYDSTSDSYFTLSNILRDREWCLDICMDFYSTQNPFQGILGSHFDFVHDIFKFRDRGTLEESLRYRKNQLGYLKSICYDTVPDDEAPGDKIPDENELHEFNEVKRTLTDKYPDLNERISLAKVQAASDEYITDLFYIGQQTELPSYISKESEISALIGRTETLLEMLSRDPVDKPPNTVEPIAYPVAITLARSEFDEYSAPGTLDKVHCLLVCMLKRLYSVSHTVECPILSP